MTSTTINRILGELVLAGMPGAFVFPPEIHTKEIEFRIKFESMGHDSNGWDDPGEGAAWYIDSNDADIIFSQDQMTWLETQFDAEVQEWAADSSNWYDPSDDDYM